MRRGSINAEQPQVPHVDDKSSSCWVLEASAATLTNEMGHAEISYLDLLVINHDVACLLVQNF